MWIWIVIFIFALALLLGGMVYISFGMARFSVVQRISGERKWRGRMLGGGLTIVLFLVFLVVFGMVNAVIIMIHLLAFWILCDAVAWICGRLQKSGSGRKRKRYVAGIVAIFITAGYLLVGAYQAIHVWEKDYSLTTAKQLGTLRVALLADSHLGTTWGVDGFRKNLAKIAEQKPDVIVIAGDFVDDGTTKEEMLDGCKALGELVATTPYGVYYVFGNHDKGYFSSRGYNGQDIIEAMKNNGIQVLEDEAVLIDDRFYLIGRQDLSENQTGRERMSIGALVSELDQEKYSIVLNHQPNDYEAEAAAGVDLVLSGHTHGGQFIPFIHAGEWIKANDATYGLSKRKSTSFIVTSGISDWELLFKTGCRSEYVIIDIVGGKNE